MQNIEKLFPQNFFELSKKLHKAKYLFFKHEK